MIRYSEKLKQDYLSPEYVRKLQEDGVDMKDAYYHIYKSDGTYYLSDHDFIEGISKDEEKQWEYVCPTYTLSELLYKLDECPMKVVTLNNGIWKGKEVMLRGITFFKDAPFYFFGYNASNVVGNDMTGDTELYDEWTCYNEFPINAAASLLLKCIKNGISYNQDISNKQ